MRSLTRFLAFLALICFLVLSLYLWRRSTTRVVVPPDRPLATVPSGTNAPSRATPETGPIPSVDARLPILSGIDREFTSLVDRLMPSVVSIEARRRLDDDPRAQLLRELFGLGRGGPQQLGSGVIVSEDGHIITNLHVIAGTDEVEVTLSDGRKLRARFLGADPLVDVAVLKIDVSNVAALRLADSNEVKVGQLVFAIGNPLGLEETVSQGIVSGKGRRANQQLNTDYIQTDAAINPGNSGGPLVNLKGEIIGINNAVALQSQGISFAIPSNIAARVLDDVVNRGKLSRPWFGVSYRVLTAPISKALGLPIESGLFIDAVGRGSPAERAGIRPGDVFIHFNGKPLRDDVDIRNRLAEVKVDDLVTIRAIRDGRELDFQVRLEDRPMR